MLLSGEGVYTPELLTSPSVSPGKDLGIGGRGFPADTEIVLGWSDGTGRITTVTTNGKGEFLLNFSTIRSQRPGLTTLVAQAHGWHHCLGAGRSRTNSPPHPPPA